MSRKARVPLYGSRTKSVIVDVGEPSTAVSPTPSATPSLSPQTLDDIADGKRFVRVRSYATTDGNVNLAKSGVIGKYGINILRSSSGTATLDRALVKQLVTDPDTIDGVPDGVQYKRQLASYMDTGRPTALWRPTGLVKVSADDLSLHSEVTDHIGGLNVPDLDFLAKVTGRTADRLIYTSTGTPTVDSLEPAEAGADPTATHESATVAALTGHNQDDLPDSTTRFAAVQAGADKTASNTSADTSKVNGVPATAISPIAGLMPAVAGSTKNLVPAQYQAENLFTDPGATDLAFWYSFVKIWSLDGSGGMVSPVLAANGGNALYAVDATGTIAQYKASAGDSITVGGTIKSVTGTGTGMVAIVASDATGTVSGGWIGDEESSSGYHERTTVLPAGTTYIQLYLYADGGASGGSATISDFFVRIGSQTSHDPGGQKSYIDLGDKTPNGHTGIVLENLPSGLYTVATLPTGVSGMRSMVSDATVTTFATIVAGGGTNIAPVFFNGSNWIIG